MECNKPKQLTDDTFIAEIGQAPYCVVFFYANYCPHSLSFGPVFLRLVAKTSKDHVRFFQMDVEQSPKTVKMFDIKSVPCLVLFRQGNEISSLAGQRACENFLGWLDEKTNP